MKEITIPVPEGKKPIWDENGMLKLVDETPEQQHEDKLFDTSIDIKERVKTFDDACRLVHGKTEKEWEEENETDKFDPDILAYLKLRIIAKALNEGWEPKFTTDEYRWFPWFVLYTQSEIDKMSEEKRRRVVLRGFVDSGSQGGVACAICDCDSSYAYANFGSRLAFTDEATARYAGQQFTEIWADFVFKPKEEK